MHFEKKLAAALTLLASTGMWRSIYAPLLLRVLWRVGLRVPPPHFRGFATNFVLATSSLGSAWVLAMWIVVWSRQGVHLPWSAIRAAAASSGLFGLLMAGYYGYGAQKHGIPRWSRFHPVDQGAFT